MATNWQENYQLYKRYVRNLALMYQKRQDVKSFIELLLSLSAIIIFGVFAIRPTIVTVIDLNNQIAGKKDTVAKLDSKIQALAEAQEVYESNRVALQLVNQAIPQNPSPELYLRQLEGLANRHSLFIIDMKTGGVPILGTAVSEVPEEESVPGLDQFPETKGYEFGFTVVGSFERVHAFLADFEALRRPLFEDTVNIRISQGELPGELALSVVGRLAYLPNE